MFTNGGIAVDSWVRVEEQCSIASEVVGDEVQFTFSGRRGGELSLVVTEAGLEKVVEHFQRALDDLRSADSADLTPADLTPTDLASADLGQLRAQ